MCHICWYLGLLLETCPRVPARFRHGLLANHTFIGRVCNRTLRQHLCQILVERCVAGLALGRQDTKQRTGGWGRLGHARHGSMPADFSVRAASAGSFSPSAAHSTSAGKDVSISAILQLHETLLYGAGQVAA